MMVFPIVIWYELQDKRNQERFDRHRVRTWNTDFFSPTTCLCCCCWSRSLRVSIFGCLGGASEPAAGSCPAGPDARISRSSLRKAPKNGTTGHSAMAKALLKARSYSAERSAADRKSNTGNVSFSVMDSQNGLSLLDLQIKKKNRLRSRTDSTWERRGRREPRRSLCDVKASSFRRPTTLYYPLEAERNPCSRAADRRQLFPLRRTTLMSPLAGNGLRFMHGGASNGSR
jgi:hypothetical protein